MLLLSLQPEADMSRRKHKMNQRKNLEARAVQPRRCSDEKKQKPRVESGQEESAGHIGRMLCEKTRGAGLTNRGLRDQGKTGDWDLWGHKNRAPPKKRKKAAIAGPVEHHVYSQKMSRTAEKGKGRSNLEEDFNEEGKRSKSIDQKKKERYQKKGDQQRTCRRRGEKGGRGRFPARKGEKKVPMRTDRMIRGRNRLPQGGA